MRQAQPEVSAASVLRVEPEALNPGLSGPGFTPLPRKLCEFGLVQECSREPPRAMEVKGKGAGA